MENDVMMLREVYRRMVPQNAERELRPSEPLPWGRTFSAPWKWDFSVQISFGTGDGGCNSAELIVYVPTREFGQIPGDVLVRCLVTLDDCMIRTIHCAPDPRYPPTGYTGDGRQTYSTIIIATILQTCDLIGYKISN